MSGKVGIFFPHHLWFYLFLRIELKGEQKNTYKSGLVFPEAPLVRRTSRHVNRRDPNERGPMATFYFPPICLTFRHVLQGRRNQR